MAKKAQKKSVNNKVKKQDKTTTLTLKIEWVVIAVISIILLASIMTSGFSNLPFGLSSPVPEVKGEEIVDIDTAKDNTLEYINKGILQGETEATLNETTEDSATGLYKMNITIEGEPYDVFITKNGKYLFTYEPQEMVIEETPEATNEPEATKEYPKQDKPEVYLFTMTYCPYGNVAEDFVEPVSQLLGDTVSILPHYIIYSDYATQTGTEILLNAWSSGIESRR